MNTRTFLISGLLLVSALIASALAYPQLADTVAIHWNFHGQADGYGSRWFALALFPLLMLLTLVVFAVSGIVSKRISSQDFAPIYFYCMLIIVTLLGYCHFLLLWANILQVFDMNRSVVGGLAVFLLLIGNVMGKVRRNRWLGIRTRWTLASDAVWYATHRFAAKFIVASALLALVLVFAGVSVIACLSLLVLSLVVPGIYSYIIAVQLKRRSAGSN